MVARSNAIIFRDEIESKFQFSQAVQAGELLYISGSVSWDQDGNTLGEGDMRTQIRNAYEDIKRTLETAGLTFRNVIKETIYTVDMDTLAANNDVRTAYYEGTTAPAGTWVEIRRLVDPKMLLEVEVVAHRHP